MTDQTESLIDLTAFEEVTAGLSEANVNMMRGFLEAYLAAEHDPKCGEKFGDLTYVCARCSRPSRSEMLRNDEVKIFDLICKAIERAHPVDAQANAVLAAISPYLKREMVVGWQPIETAPKDGSKFLVWIKHNPKLGHAVDWQHATVAQWIEHNGGGLTWNGLAGEPTHWMPLPANPTCIEVAEGKP